MCGSDLTLTYNIDELLSHVGYEYGQKYPPNVNCTRTIEAPLEMNVELLAEVFYLEYHT